MSEPHSERLDLAEKLKLLPVRFQRFVVLVVSEIDRMNDAAFVREAAERAGLSAEEVENAVRKIAGKEPDHD